MILRNLTSNYQEVLVKDFDNVYTIKIAPRGVTEISRVLIMNADKLAGLVEIDGNVAKKVETPVRAIEVEETPEVGESSANTEINPAEESIVDEEFTEESESTPEVAPDKFICKECGAEFASERGLSSHMNRVHSQR